MHQPEAYVARSMPRVHERDGRLEDALARAHVVAEHGDRRVEARAVLIRVRVRVRVWVRVKVWVRVRVSGRVRARVRG